MLELNKVLSRRFQCYLQLKADGRLFQDSLHSNRDMLSHSPSYQQPPQQFEGAAFLERILFSC